jgi:hypothetical protein
MLATVRKVLKELGSVLDGSDPIFALFVFILLYLILAIAIIFIELIYLERLQFTERVLSYLWSFWRFL